MTTMRICSICDRRFLKGWMLELTKLEKGKTQDQQTHALCAQCAPVASHFFHTTVTQK